MTCVHIIGTRIVILKKQCNMNFFPPVSPSMYCVCCPVIVYLNLCSDGTKSLFFFNGKRFFLIGFGVLVTFFDNMDNPQASFFFFKNVTSIGAHNKHIFMEQEFKLLDVIIIRKFFLLHKNSNLLVIIVIR